MFDVEGVVKAAQLLSQQDDEALEILVAKRELAIRHNPDLGVDLSLDPAYVSPTMGLQELKALGQRIVQRWNKELYGLVCGGGNAPDKARTALLEALNLGEAAVIAAVASALLGLGVTAAIAAALAPILVRRFILPAGGELCSAWGEAVNEQS